jgi:hypothetical protein
MKSTKYSDIRTIIPAGGGKTGQPPATTTYGHIGGLLPDLHHSTFSKQEDLSDEKEKCF